MGKRRRRKTWAELIVERVGFRRAPRVLAFVMQWSLVENELGHRPTVEEYAQWWGADWRTCYRDLELFREALPWFEHPSGFLAVAGVDLRQRVPAEYLTDGAS